MDLLTNAIQPYAWGSRSAIATLQGRQPVDTPEAELWMGAHPSAPSTVTRDASLTLLQVIDADPVGELGVATLDAFGPRLPYLLKILAAERALSLQVHPTPEQARAGFAAEEAADVPRNAPNRNYRDPYSKPELIVALTPFVGLCGFRAATDLAELLAELKVPALKEFADTLAARPDEHSVRAMLASLLSWPDDDRSALVAEVSGACAALAGKASPFATTYRWVGSVAEDYPADTGVVVMLMLNLIELAPGQGIFLQPRTLHAYLTGVGVEIMAGSDNVLRCGLTPKHIDTDELLNVLDFRHGSLDPTPITALSDVEDAWITPTPEFRLSRLVVGSEPVQLNGGVPQILVCTEGAVTFDSDGDTLDVTGGQSVFIPAASAGVRVTAPAHGVVFRAVPGL